MEALVIRDRDGHVIQRSRNLAGIRRYVGGRYAPIIKTLAVDRVGQWEGRLSILFDGGESFQAPFASFEVLCDFVRRWKNVHGAPLMVVGERKGVVTKNHPALS